MSFESNERKRLRRAFWAGFFSAFSLDITGRTQARMMRDALDYERTPRTTREVLERTDEEALAADEDALAADWAAVAKDFPTMPQRQPRFR